MKRLAWVLGVPLLALSMIGLIGGDPRAGSELSRADAVCGAGLAVAVVAAVLAWRIGPARSRWLLLPTVFLAISGGLCGWIAAAEFTHQPDVAVRVVEMPARAAFMIGLTALGMALPALGVTSLFTPRGTART